MKICGVTIWYNPGVEEVNNIYSYINNVDKLLIIDNSSENNNILLKDINKVEYVPNYENLGIAKALNMGCELAIEYGFQWVLTMDQDSNFSEEMIYSYIKRSEEMIEKDSQIAIFAPYTDQNEEYGYVNRVITSGNILNLDKYKKAGKFDDDLFIDEVDHDLCFKLINKGYKIFKFNDIKLKHKLGNSKSISLGNKKISAMNHGYIRKYYIMRNRCIINKRYPEYTQFYKKDNIKDLIKVILIEKDKIKKIKYMYKGYVDYKQNKLGKLE